MDEAKGTVTAPAKERRQRFPNCGDCSYEFGLTTWTEVTAHVCPDNETPDIPIPTPNGFMSMGSLTASLRRGRR